MANKYKKTKERKEKMLSTSVTGGWLARMLVERGEVEGEAGSWRQARRDGELSSELNSGARPFPSCMNSTHSYRNEEMYKLFAFECLKSQITVSHTYSEANAQEAELFSLAHVCISPGPFSTRSCTKAHTQTQTP